MLFILRQQYSLYKTYEKEIADCDVQIQAQLHKMASTKPQAGIPTAPQSCSCETKHKTKANDELRKVLHQVAGVDLTAIDGIDTRTSQVVLSEIGTDMSPWPTEKHFTSWLGLCPNHQVSGGKILKRHTRRVINRASIALRCAAYTLLRSRSALGAKYRRLRARLGAPKAITAIAHHLARLIYRMIRFGHEYVDKGVKQYEEKYREQQLHWLQKKAEEFGLQIIDKQPALKAVS